MGVYGWLSRVGARTFIVGEIASVIMLAKSCAAPPACEGETCPTGGSAGAAGSPEGGTGGVGGTGGTLTAGSGGTGAGGAATGGSGTGATGGGGTTGSTGGAGGSGGCELYQCAANDCGLVDNGCEAVVDCGGCGEQSGPEDGPMVCSASHACECPAEGDSPEAMGKCGANTDNPTVPQWCAEHGGCHTALCGTPPVPKVPETCRYGGGLDSGVQVWCCATP